MPAIPSIKKRLRLCANLLKHQRYSHIRSTQARPGSPSAGDALVPRPSNTAIAARTLPFWRRLGPLSRAFEAYDRSQRSRPYLTRLFSTLAVYFLGDVSAQRIAGEAYDPFRALRALAIGAGASGPIFKWFMFLGSHFNYSSKVLTLTAKVAVNQLVFAPVFNTYFFGMQSFLSGGNLSEICERIKNTVPVAFVNSCKLWPAVTAFSFTFIGPHYRSIFSGFVAVGWQTYLSYLNRRAEETTAEGLAAHEHAT